jgi:hypothetical protein
VCNEDDQILCGILYFTDTYYYYYYYAADGGKSSIIASLGALTTGLVATAVFPSTTSVDPVSHWLPPM